jgi:hypothetical protein
MSREERLPLWGITPKPEPDHAPFWGVTPKAEEIDVTPPWAVQAVSVKQEKRPGQAIVKQEKGQAVVKQEERRPGQAVVKQEEPDERKIRIRLVHPPDKPPWAGPVPRDEASAYQRGPLPAPAEEKPVLEEPRTSSKRKQGSDRKSPPPSSRLISARNYVAVEAGREAFLAGRMPKKLYSATPSSPTAGLITPGKPA